MSATANVKIEGTPEYGVILHFSDIEAADAFEDLLTEECYVLTLVLGLGRFFFLFWPSQLSNGSVAFVWTLSLR